MTGRMIMLGLDGADWTLINEWAAAGRLPALAQLIGKSRRLDLEVANKYVPGATWPDIATGVSVAGHGYIFHEQLRRGSYRPEAYDPSSAAAPPFYKALSDAGISCAVVDMPVTQPLDNFNGIHVIDWGPAHQLWHFETQPRSFASELTSAYGRHPLNGSPTTHLDLPGLLALKQKLQVGIRMRQQLTLDLLRQREHEFIFMNFCELHKAGHFLWRFHDRTHPEYTEAEPQLIDSLRDIYEAFDRALGRIVSALSGSDDLVVVSDRGMGPNYRGDHLMDEILIALELATPRSPFTPKKSPPRVRLPSGLRARKLYRFVADRLPNSMREALLPLHRAAIGEAPPFDWRHTRLFRMPTVGETHLRVNLAGREPEGIVSAGAEYEALLAEVAAQFRALVNPTTGERVVTDIIFPAKHFAGPQSAALPDITLLWSKRAPINAVTSSGIGLIAHPQPPDRTGNHRPTGFALFHGPTFAAGSKAEPGDARQIAPTVLQRFGVAIPAHYDLEAPQSIWRRAVRAFAAA